MLDRLVRQQRLEADDHEPEEDVERDGCHGSGAVELLRRQTVREVPDPPPPDLGGSMRRGMDRVRGRKADEERLAALERLGRLHEQGVLSDDEFAAEKAQLVRQ